MIDNVNVKFEAMNIKEKYEEILVGYIGIHDREELIEELLNLHLVMLTETLKQAEEKADKIDEIQDPSGMEAVGFSNGAYWVVKKLKEKLRSA